MLTERDPVFGHRARMGTRECLVYTVHGGLGSEGQISVFSFARDLPGPPVLLIVLVRGEQTLRNEMIEQR